jgi:hypothetical protein
MQERGRKDTGREGSGLEFWMQICVFLLAFSLFVSNASVNPNGEPSLFSSLNLNLQPSLTHADSFTEQHTERNDANGDYRIEHGKSLNSEVQLRN